MLPVYDPKSFDGIDLRKYHIRTVADVIKFNEFVAARLGEAEHVLKKFNTQFATLRGITTQMQKKAEEDAKDYGAPTPVNDEHPEIQSAAKEETADQRNADLLNEIRQAAAEETLVPDADEDPNERATYELEKYKLVVGKKYPMFYRKGDKGFQLVKLADVPEDIKEALMELAKKDGK